MFPKSFVSGQGQELLDKNPIHDETAIFLRVSSLVAARVHNKKDGLIKYVPASGIDPATGTWQILDIDTQPLKQFAGNLPVSRIEGNIGGKLPISSTDGNLPLSRLAGTVNGKLPLSLTDENLPASRLDNIDMSKVATGVLDISRINNFHVGLNNRFLRIIHAVYHIHHFYIYHSVVKSIP